MLGNKGFSTGFIGELAVERDVAGFSFGWWRASPYGDGVEAHGHDDPHFMYIATGRYITSATSGDTERAFAPLVFSPSQTFHRDRFHDGTGLFFAISLPRRQIELAGDVRLPATSFRVEIPRAHALVFELMRECASWTPDSSLKAEGVCLELADAIGLNDRRERTPPKWLIAVIERLSEGLNEALAMDDLARVAGVHPFHLNRTFRRFCRSTPGDFRRARRLERAATLLATTGHSLIEIALETGFADQSHLNSHFRRAYGFPPGRFRQHVNPRKGLF